MHSCDAYGCEICQNNYEVGDGVVRCLLIPSLSCFSLMQETRLETPY